MFLKVSVIIMMRFGTLVDIQKKNSINAANGSCMFSVLFESVLIEVKNKGDQS